MNKHANFNESSAALLQASSPELQFPCLEKWAASIRGSTTLPLRVASLLKDIPSAVTCEIDFIMNAFNDVVSDANYSYRR